MEATWQDSHRIGKAEIHLKRRRAGAKISGTLYSQWLQ